MARAGRKPGKVFGIGLSRTGTASLNRALCLLGYRSLHYPDLSAELVSGSSSLSRHEPFDAMTDTPVVPLFAELFHVYPESLFVLTWRDKSHWLDACGSFFAAKDNAGRTTARDRLVRMLVYGCEEYSRQRFSEAYDRHLEKVAHVFTGSAAGRLLVHDVFAGDSWASLCRFLGEPEPGTPYPHEHVRSSLEW